MTGYFEVDACGGPGSALNHTDDFYGAPGRAVALGAPVELRMSDIVVSRRRPRMAFGRGRTMTDDSNAIVPVWTLATGDVRVPAVAFNEPMTAERLIELRSGLAALADQPFVTLEPTTAATSRTAPRVAF